MALSKSFQKAQFPLPCELCEIETKIQWKCIDCNLLLCDKCKNKVHSKFKKAKDHKIITIREVGLQDDDSGQNFSDSQYKDQEVKQIRIRAIKDYNTELSQVTELIRCSENTFWIHDYDPNIIQKVALLPDSTITVLSDIYEYAYAAALTANGNLLISDLTSKLKILIGNGKKQPIMEYNFKTCIEENKFKQYRMLAIHINREDQLIVGAVKKLQIDYSVPGGGVIMVMDMDGNHQEQIEFDRNNEPLLTNPTRITTTQYGQICIIDHISEDHRGRVVMVEDTVNKIYDGHADINSKNHPFKPSSIVTTPNDNVIVSDSYNNTLHFLDHSGHLLAYCNTIEHDIQRPYSMLCSKSGKLLIGSSTLKYGTPNAIIFEVEIPKDL